MTERIPLAQRLGTTDDTEQLIGQFARLYCDDYFPMLDELMGTNCTGDLELAGGYHLAVWLARLDEMFPGSTSEGRAHLLYRYIVAPFARIKEKGEIDHE